MHLLSVASIVHSDFPDALQQYYYSSLRTAPGSLESVPPWILIGRILSKFWKSDYISQANDASASIGISFEKFGMQTFLKTWLEEVVWLVIRIPHTCRMVGLKADFSRLNELREVIIRMIIRWRAALLAKRTKSGESALQRLKDFQQGCGFVTSKETFLWKTGPWLLYPPALLLHQPSLNSALRNQAEHVQDDAVEQGDQRNCDGW